MSVIAGLNEEESKQVRQRASEMEVNKFRSWVNGRFGKDVEKRKAVKNVLNDLYPETKTPVTEEAAEVSETAGATETVEVNNEIDEQAQEAATSVNNEIPEPSQAQIEAGNYKKGHVSIHGMDISIENPKGSTRRSKPEAKNQWEQEMQDHYGYIKGTDGS